MKLHLIAAVMFSLATTASAQNPLTPQALPEPILSGKSEFRIPYQYDPAEIARLGAREIRLFGSTDQGLRWQLIQTVRPESGRFQFRAPADGDYWFSVQTVDNQGATHPAGPMKPGLIVRVDTTQPIFQLQLQPNGDKVQLTWNASDASLDPNSMQFQYTQTGMTGWKQLPFGVFKPVGQTQWTIPNGGLVAVRGSIRDKAGNATTTQVTAQIQPVQAPLQNAQPNSNSTRPQPAFPDPREPIASSNPQVGPLRGGPDQSYNPVLQAMPSFNNEAPIPSAIQSRDQVQIPQQQYPVPQDRVPQLPFENPNRDRRIGDSNYNPQVVQEPNFPNENTQLPPTQFPPNQQSVVDQNTFNPNQRMLDPIRQDTYVSASNPIAASQVPYTPRQSDRGYRIVRTRKFNIDYRVDDVGPSGVGSVEMFVTTNNGEKWYRYGVDKDRRSPFEVEVPKDGLYGFSMRVVSGAGLTEEPPRPGDRPEIVVVTDSSPPVVRLFPLQQGTGPNANKILITWQASDQKLAERPVALSYSANPNGPWEPISGWQPNTGQYVWSVGQGVPARLYVRLLARDAAGNLKQVDTPQPVLVDLAKPTARIVDVESTRLPQR